MVLSRIQGFLVVCILRKRRDHGPIIDEEAGSETGWRDLPMPLGVDAGGHFSTFGGPTAGSIQLQSGTA